LKKETFTGGSPDRLGRGSQERVGPLLRDNHRDLIISNRTLEKARGIELVRIKPEQANQDLCFCSRPFVLCGLPVRRLPPGQLLYQRRNGQFVLQITGNPEYGVPFGQDRIVPIFLATLAVQQKSPTIRFRSAREMLSTFGLQKGGFEYRRLGAPLNGFSGHHLLWNESDTSPCNARSKVALQFLARGTNLV
jgi:hypothetical protein